MLENLRYVPDRLLAIARYRSLAANYDASCWALGGMRRRALAMLALREGEVVIDVGCGTGPMLVPLARRVGKRGRVVGIEQCPEMIAQARERVRCEGVAEVVVLIDASVEETSLALKADALLFSYTHDVLQSPAALDVLFRCARPSARVVVAGARFLPWWYAAPLNAWTAFRARNCLTTYHGLRRPWRYLQHYCPDFTPIAGNFLGTGYLGIGTFQPEKTCGTSDPSGRSEA